MPAINQTQRQIAAMLITCVFCWIFSYFTICVFWEYAFGLFVWLPFSLGASSTIIHGYKNTVPTKGRLRLTAFSTLLLFCVGLLLFAFEGVICLAMAAPIGLLFTWLGYLVGYQIIRNKRLGNTVSPVAVVLLLLSVPAVMAFDYMNKDREYLRSVTSSVTINASPETVWRNIIGFPKMSAPTEFVFKTGIAYPIDATIEGRGVGAVRHCNFSTGSFVEPITTWDEPHLLQFSVVDQPEPMREVSPYDIHPNHLHGYWVSKRGQFKLTALPNGQTLLEGTTWYVNKIQPDWYWATWSDYIVHTIHQRVLRHIKAESEPTSKMQ